MRRSDGPIAVGIGECTSREGFDPDTRTMVGDKLILYTNHNIEYTTWKRASMGVAGPELCTWGKLGVHYKMAYEFPDEHKRRDGIIQNVKDIEI